MIGTESTRAALHLTRADPQLGRVIERVGTGAPPQSPAGFPALVRAIVYQQITGAAGDAIVHRLVRAGGVGRLPGPAWFRSSAPETLRGAGLSPQKIGYIEDLARRVGDGRLHLAGMRRNPDEEVVRALSEVRGIGRWTAQMYLLFHLGRPDVLPTGDLGLRKAVQRLTGMRSLPAESTVARIGRPWAPYRSYATHYLWRSLEARPPIRERPVNAASRRTATRRRRSRPSPRAAGAPDRPARR
ncbi:MAG: DNA-3-methyladenine glycosylase family protein [Thermoplasmata archaeon]